MGGCGLLGAATDRGKHRDALWATLGVSFALMASVPFWYTAIPIFVWDRDMGFRKNTLTYWVVIWGMFPAFGVVAGVYCLVRLLE